VAKKKKQKNKPGGAPVGRPGVGPAGQGFDPADLPEEAAPEAPEPGAAPLGLPISPEAFEELQRKARRKTPPPTDCAQEDPSGEPEGG
jgi:hypothetical protein